MGLLFGQIWLWIIVAALLGLALGWWLWAKYVAESEAWKLKWEKLDKKYKQLVDELNATRDALDASKKAHTEAEDRYQRLLARLRPEHQKKWERLDKGALGVLLPVETERDAFKSKYEKLLAKIEPELKSGWEKQSENTLGLTAPLKAKVAHIEKERDTVKATLASVTSERDGWKSKYDTSQTHLTTRTQQRDDIDGQFKLLFSKVESTATENWQKAPEASLGLVEPLKRRAAELESTVDSRTTERDDWKTKYKSLFEKVDDEGSEKWQSLPVASLGLLAPVVSQRDTYERELAVANASLKQAQEEVVQTKSEVVRITENFDSLLTKLELEPAKEWQLLDERSLAVAKPIRERWNRAEGIAQQRTAERDESNSRFARLFSKLEKEKSANWDTLPEHSLGIVDPLRNRLEQVEKARDNAINELDGIRAKIETAHVSNWEQLDDQSLGLVAPIRQELEATHTDLKTRTEDLILANDRFERLHKKVVPAQADKWEQLQPNVLGLVKPVEEDLAETRKVLDKLVNTVAPAYRGSWQNQKPGTLTIPDYTELETLRAELSTLKEEIENVPNPDGSPKWIGRREQTPDDLKQIWGVGKVLERMLNENGIYYFWQVAKLDTQSIEWLSSQLGCFPDRITRDDWVTQAWDLAHKKAA